MPSTDTPWSDLDLFGDDVLHDPYPAYADLRQRGAVVHLRQHDVYALTRHAEARAALRD